MSINRLPCTLVHPLFVRYTYRPGFRHGITRLYVQIVVGTRLYVLQIALVRTIHGSPREFQVSTYLQNTPSLDIRLRVISLFGYGRIIRQKSERINVNELKLSTSAFLHVPRAKPFLFAFSFFFFFFSRFFFLFIL